MIKVWFFISSIIFLNCNNLKYKGTGFFVANNKTLFDANGNEFLIRGINSPHAWYDSYKRNYSYNSLPAISATGANTVRIVWLMNLSGGLDNSYLETIIKKCIDTQMVKTWIYF